MIFIDDEYSKEYYAIISIAKNRAKTRNELLQLAPNYIIEKHHIIPESFFLIRKRNPKNPGWIDGDADDATNIVYLFAKEHYRVHWLLAQMTLNDVIYATRAKEYMACALFRMSSGKLLQKRYKVLENDYLLSKTLLRAAKKEKTRKPNSAESNEKRRQKLIGKKRPADVIEKGAAKRRGQKRTAEQIQRIIDSHKGLPSSNKGKTFSQEWRDNLSKSHKGQINKWTTEQIAKREETKRKNRMLILESNQYDY